MDFLVILACESLSHSQGGASPVTPHAPMADVYYGPDGPSRNYNYWTGNAIGFRASRELCSNFLLISGRGAALDCKSLSLASLLQGLRLFSLVWDDPHFS